MGVLHRRGSRGPVELYDSICKYLPQTRVESGFHFSCTRDTFRALIYSFPVLGWLGNLMRDRWLCARFTDGRLTNGRPTFSNSH